MDPKNYNERLKIIKSFQTFCENKYGIEFGDIASDEILSFFIKHIGGMQDGTK